MRETELGPNVANDAPVAQDLPPVSVFLSERHQMVLGLLEYAASRQTGVGLVTGSEGMGKSTLLAELEARLRPLTTFARWPHATSARDETETLASVFGVLWETSRPPAERLLEFAAARAKEGRPCVLVVDDAHRLTMPTLRMLQSWTTPGAVPGTTPCTVPGATPVATLRDDDGTPPIALILVGDAPLRRSLAVSGLDPLARHITVDFHLEPMTRDEVHAFLRFLMRRQHCSDHIIEQNLLESVYLASDGRIARVASLIGSLRKELGLDCRQWRSEAVERTLALAGAPGPAARALSEMLPADIPFTESVSTPHTPAQINREVPTRAPTADRQLRAGTVLGFMAGMIISAVFVGLFLFRQIDGRREVAAPVASSAVALPARADPQPASSPPSSPPQLNAVEPERSLRERLRRERAAAIAQAQTAQARARVAEWEAALARERERSATLEAAQAQEQARAAQLEATLKSPPTEPPVSSQQKASVETPGSGIQAASPQEPPSASPLFRVNPCLGPTARFMSTCREP